MNFFFFVILFYSEPFGLVAGTIPSISEVRLTYEKSEGAILDRNGKILHEMRIDNKTRSLEWTPFSEISPALIKSVIFAEDRNFFQHRGVDWKSILRAAFNTLSSGKKQGASTITMQLSGFINPELKPKGKNRSLLQKLEQIHVAGKIEDAWTKEEILEAYLNLITYRGELRGINTASRGIFNKYPSGLNETESVILATLIKSPNNSVSRIARDSCRLSAAINPETPCKTIQEFVNSKLGTAYSITSEYRLTHHLAGKLFSEVQNPGGNRNIRTTLDKNVQIFATEALKNHLRELLPKNVKDGAILIVENTTGNVLAYAGNTGELSTAKEVDAVVSHRQAGSTLKPFLYALAYEKNLITPDSIILDSSLDIPVQTGIYRPSNYENEFHGEVKSRVALASSLNVPAVKILNLTGIDPLIEKMEKAGFRGLKDGEFYGPSLALGSPDVTLWELVGAYRTLANKGIYTPLVTLPEQSLSKSINPDQVFSEKTASVITEILSDRDDRSLTFGLENPLNTRFHSAVKTGTSKDMRDNWCIGYSNQFTVGVWVGNFSGEPMWNVSGVTGAAPIWRESIDWLEENYSGGSLSAKGKSQIQSDGKLKKIEVAIPYNTETERKLNRIIYPANNTIIAIDPDIPDSRQKVFFESGLPSNTDFWVLDSQKIGMAANVFLWNPKKGKHFLFLINSKDELVDSVKFEVR